MIKITVNPDHEPKSYCLDLPIIVIGDGSPDAVNICFPCEGLHQNHLKIFLNNKDGYWVLNQANDPFVTLNGQPFGKKKLNAGDQLQIRDHLLRIDEISLTSLPAKIPEPIPQPTIQEEENSEIPLNFPDMDNLANAENPEAWFPTDLPGLESIAKELESPKNSAEQKKPRAASKTSPSNWKKRALKAAMIVFVLVVGFLGISLTELYYRAMQQNDKEEMLAAESLSDYAMALTYAKVFHVAPQKQNWVDPQFIKNNLIDILSSSSIPCGNIDMQGQFANCAYMLRFYTNGDFSRFLLIAQPSPTISQWLIPKGSFIVDSELMEIHKIHDLRLLNRLLSNPNPLDSENSSEVLSEIRLGKVIELDTLAKNLRKKDFSPPAALRYIKPGSEDLIYNAPRYHQLGSTFLKAVNAPEHFRGSEIEALSKFKDLVFYSTEGIEQALQGHHSLKSISFPNNFFVAYLLYSPTGEILNSHIVLESSPDNKKSNEDTVIASEIASVDFFSKPEGEEGQIAALLKDKADRVQSSIGPIVQSLHTLLEAVIEKESFYLSPTFYHLVDLYESQAQKIREDIENSLTAFRRKNPNLNEFIVERYLREYGLRDFYHNIPTTKGKEKRDYTPTFSYFQPSYSFLNLNQRLSLQKKWNAFHKLQSLSYQPSHIPYTYCPGANCLLIR